MWYEYLFQVLNNINSVILCVIGIPFFLQIIYMIFFWLPKKKYPKSDKKGKVIFLIAAHNEEDVIYKTVDELLNKQEYPKELISVLVVAHNCTDKTVELATKAGATVIEYIDDDPSHARAAYPLNAGFKYIIDNKLDYDFIIRVDADNLLATDFLSLMNDAYQSGVDFGRGYESAINIKQSAYTKACGLYYIYDSRFSSRVRERFHIGAHVNGPGAMFSKKMIDDIGVFNCFSLTEDVEMTIKAMRHGYKGHFVEDAVVYEDFPSTMKDTYNRNTRMAKGVIHLLPKCITSFFKTGKFSFIELFMALFLVFDSLVLCTWIPIFYIYSFTFLALAGNNVFEVSLFTSEYYINLLYTTAYIAIIAVSVLFLFCGMFQGFMLVMLDYKKMGCKNRRELLIGALLFPIFSVVYIATCCIGIFKKPKREKIHRNTNYTSS